MSTQPENQKEEKSNEQLEFLKSEIAEIKKKTSIEEIEKTIDRATYSTKNLRTVLTVLAITQAIFIFVAGAFGVFSVKTYLILTSRSKKLKK